MSEINTDPSNVWDFLKVFIPLTMTFSLLWRFIDKYFKNQSEERVALISEVAKKAAVETVKETMKEIMTPINLKLTEMDKKIDENAREIHSRIDEVLIKKS